MPIKGVIVVLIGTFLFVRSLTPIKWSCVPSGFLHFQPFMTFTEAKDTGLLGFYVLYTPKKPRKLERCHKLWRKRSLILMLLLISGIESNPAVDHTTTAPPQTTAHAGAENHTTASQLQTARKVGVPPSLNQSSKSTFKKAVGSPITIRCSAVGNPKPKIGLYHGSVLRHHVANGKPLIYTNPSLKASDFGCYQCIAKNAFGFDQRNITVIREGYCSISTKVYNETTPFTVNCTSWQDFCSPLKYQVAYIKGTLTTVICNHKKPICKAQLPLGTDSGDSLKIRVRIFDSKRTKVDESEQIVLKLTAEKLLRWKLRPLLRPQTPPPTNKAYNLSKGFKLLNTTNDTQELAERIGFIASRLNYESKNTINQSNEEIREKTKLRDFAMEKLTSMTISANPFVVPPLIANLAEVPTEFSPYSANLATSNLDQITKNFIAKNNTADEFSTIVDNLVTASLTVTKSISINLHPQKKIRIQGWTKNKGKSNVLKNQEIINNITFVVSSYMNSGDDYKVNISKFGFLIEKNVIKGGERLVSDVLDGQIILPLTNEMEIPIKDVTSRMIMSTYNQYFWDDSSLQVKSDVLSYSLFTSNGTRINIKDSKNPIVMRIPRRVPPYPPYEDYTLEMKTNYHEIPILNSSSLHIEILPANYCINFHVLLKYGKHPTNESFIYKGTVPDFSRCKLRAARNISTQICHRYNELASLLNHTNKSMENIDSETRESMDREMMKTISSLCPAMKDSFRLFISDRNTRNGNYYLSISRTNTMDLKVTKNSLSSYANYKCPLTDNGLHSYRMRTFGAKCIFWDARNEVWSSHGCKIGKMTTVSSTKCLCNHLTSFASDFFVVPNLIDIRKVATGFQNFDENYSTTVVLASVIGIYILLLVFLRRKDEMDKSKVKLNVVDQGSENSSYQYILVIFTGARVNSGTTASVCFSLKDEYGETEPKLLLNENRSLFNRDQVDAFKICFNRRLGDVPTLRVWHDNKGDHPPWYLSRAFILDIQTEAQHLFIFEDWLAVQYGDGQIEREAAPTEATNEHVSSLVLTTRIANEFCDNHIWLSVFLKRPYDAFTRKERATCCLVLFLTTLLTSAMFYTRGENTVYIARVGPFKIDLKAIIIAVESTLIVLPLNIILNYLFRHSPRASDIGHHRHTKDWSRHHKHKRNLSLKYKKIGKSNTLSVCWLYLAWIFSFLLSAGSIAIIIMYSLQWGDNKSKQWMLTAFASFGQSFIVIEPVKLLVIAILLAIIVKNHGDDIEVIDVYKEAPQVISQTQHIAQPGQEDPHVLRPFSGKQLEDAQKRAKHVIRLRYFLQDLGAYIVYLAFMSIVIHVYRDQDGYLVSKAVENSVNLTKFRSVKDVSGLWSWVYINFTPGMYQTNLYDGQIRESITSQPSYVLYRVGTPRIRQVRGRKEICQISDVVNNLFKRCVRPYNIYDEEMRDFDISWKFSFKTNASKDEAKGGQRRSKSKVRTGIDSNKGGSSGKSILGATGNWVIPKKYLQNVQSGKIKPFPMHWGYHGANELGELPYFGKFATYSGGGYVINLGSDFEYAKAAVASSYQDSWIDAQTRAVFFEFTVFNVNTKYYATASVVAEIIPTGKTVATGKIHVFRLNRYEGIGGKLILSTEIILLLLIFFFLYKDVRYMFKIGLREYCKRFWSWIDMTITTALISGMVLWFIRWYQEYQIMLRLKESKNSFIGFQYAAIADEMLNTSVAFVIFFSIFKLIEFLGILPTIAILKGTILKSMRPLLYFSPQFFIPFVGFALFANLAFFQVKGFSNMVRTTVTQCQMVLGRSVFKTLKEMPKVLVSFYFCLFVILETFILMNMFKVILCESISNSSSTQELKRELQQKDLEFIDFAFAKLKDTFHYCFPMGNQRIEVPPPEETTVPLSGVESQQQEVDQTLNRSEAPASKRTKRVDLQDLHVEVGRKFGHQRSKAPPPLDIKLKHREVDAKQRLLENLIVEIESRFDAIDKEWRDYYEKKRDMFFDILLCRAGDYTFDTRCYVKIPDKVKKMSVAEFLR